jgi:hypothetical protein
MNECSGVNPELDILGEPANHADEFRMALIHYVATDMPPETASAVLGNPAT